jgi:N-glycosylase/DNA lyase
MWRDLADATGSRLRLAPSLLSGMSFRWKQRADCVFEGVLGSDAYELREAADGVQWRVVSAFPAGDAELRLRAHLSLDRGVDVDAWLPQLHEPPACFVTACTHLGGVRVLSVAQLEAVVTFMGSANNNIKRNMQMVEALCAHFGTNAIETVPGTASAHFRFPSVAQLCELSEAQLWELGWGYRAPRLHKLARQLAERGGENFLLSLSTLPEPAARAALCELCGIGRKVADCVLLFAYGHDGCVPVDTHCLQLAQTRLLPAVRGLSLTPAVYDRIVARFHELFGAQHAGWAFMVRSARARARRRPPPLHPSWLAIAPGHRTAPRHWSERVCTPLAPCLAAYLSGDVCRRAVRLQKAGAGCNRCGADVAPRRGGRALARDSKRAIACASLRERCLLGRPARVDHCRRANHLSAGGHECVGTGDGGHECVGPGDT